VAAVVAVVQAASQVTLVQDLVAAVVVLVVTVEAREEVAAKDTAALVTFLLAETVEALLTCLPLVVVVAVVEAQETELEVQMALVAQEEQVVQDRF
jgi:hypothetical protein